MNYKAETMALMKADMNADLNVDMKSVAMYSTGNGDLSLYKENADYRVGHLSGWDYFQNYYYPYVIKESYPVYIQERAQDKGKQAFEILKVLKDKGFIKIEKVEDFIEAMDALIKTL